MLTTGSLTIAALVLAACSNSTETLNQTGAAWSIPSQDPTAAITVLTYQTEDDLKVVLDGFKKVHPTITVNVQTVPFESLGTTVEKDISSKNGNPDVYLIDPSQVAGFTLKGYTEDLTAQFSPYASRWDKASVEADTIDGKLNAVPLATSTQLLFYNKDLLDKAGIPAPSADPGERLTWEQVTDQAKKAIRAGAASGLLFGQPATYYALESLPVSLGGSPGATGKNNLTPDVTSDAWIKAMTWYGSIFRDGIMPKSMATGSQRATFAAGKAAFIVDGPWTLPTIAKSSFNWGVAPMPYFQDGKPVTPTGDFDLAMNPFSKNKEAAAIFIKYLAVDGGEALLSDLPASAEDREKVYQQPAWQSPQGQDATKIVDHELQNTAVNRVRTVGYAEFEEIMNRTFSDIGNGADPKTALNAASDQIKSAWAKYQ